MDRRDCSPRTGFCWMPLVSAQPGHALTYASILLGVQPLCGSAALPVAYGLDPQTPSAEAGCDIHDGDLSM